MATEKNQVIIAVDSGRDGIKSMKYEKGEYTKLFIKACYTNVDFAYLEDIPVLNFSSKIDPDNFTCDVIASIDGEKPIAYGKICDKLFTSKQIQYVTADKIYLEYSIYYTLVSIARLVKDGDSVVLGVNFTAKNIKSGKNIVPKLKGKHKVTFYSHNSKELETVHFNVEQVGPFFQGWVSYLNFAFDKKFNVVEKYAEKEAMLLDMGRRTLGAILIRELTPIDLKCYDHGVEEYFSNIRDLLLRWYQVDKSSYEIANIILKNKELKPGDGAVVDFDKVKVEAGRLFAEAIRNDIKNDFQNVSPDILVFVGGGVHMFFDMMKSLFTDIETVDDPVYSNCMGLLKLMIRKFVYGKKGSEKMDKIE